MNLKNIKIGKNNYLFVNEYWDRSNAWGHRSTLFKNGYKLEDHSIRYYNRTWEAYTYQSVMKCLVDKLIKNAEERAINSYKLENNVKRLQENIKVRIIKKDPTIKELKKVLEELK